MNIENSIYQLINHYRYRLDYKRHILLQNPFKYYLYDKIQI